MGLSFSRSKGLCRALNLGGWLALARSRKTTGKSKSSSTGKTKAAKAAEEKVESVAEEVTDAAAEVSSKAEDTVEAAKEAVEDAEFTDLPKDGDVPSSDDAAPADATDDAAEVSADADTTDAPAPSADAPETEEAAAEESAPDTTDETTEIVDGENLEEVSATEVDVVDEPPAPVVASPPPTETVSPLTPMLPLLAGGLIAGAIGFFAGRYYDERNTPEIVGPTPTENSVALAEQTERLDGIETTLSEVAARDIGGEISEAVAPVGVAVTDISTRVDGLAGALSTLSERVETIALRPTATGIEADEFDDALGEFRTQLQSTIDQAKVEIDKARMEAESISEQAFAAEQEALVRSAWSQIETALESGAPYREPLDELQSVLNAPVPDLLMASADDGIPQLAALQQEFPTVARAALDASIRTTSNEGGAVDKLTSFLRVQAGVRSLAPREGDDPDAVLSRAEAALRSGDVATTLEEIKSLPEAGQSALSEWAGAATTRLDVLGAASDFASTLQ